SCNGGNDGAINLAVSSGQSPYNYMWSTSATLENVVGLAKGSYSVTVTDNAGCSAITSTTITEPAALALSSSFNNPTCPTNNYDGSIMLSVTGGSTPYQFVWSNGAGSANLLNVAPGNYTVTVSDANNCTVGSAFSLAYIYDFSVQSTPPVTIKLGESTILGYAITGNAGIFVSYWSPYSSLSCTDCISAVAAPNVT